MNNRTVAPTWADIILSRLSRITTSGRFIPEMDGFRFFAIMFVVALHLSGAYQSRSKVDYSYNLLTRILAQGDVGICLFYAISGFILGLPFAEHFLNGEKAVDLRRYYLRRVTRLEPPYFIAMFIYLVLECAMHGHTLAYLLPHFGAGLLYLHNFVYGYPNPLLVAAHTLEIEVQFYILAPLLTCIFLLDNLFVRRSVLVVAIIVLSLWRDMLSPQGQNFIQFNILGQLNYFFIGFLLVDIYLTKLRHATVRHLAWDVVATIGFVGALIPFAEEFTTLGGQFVMRSLMIFLAYIGSFQSLLWSAIVRNRWITACGGMCYTIYLFHKILLGIFLNRFAALLPPIGHNYAVNLLIMLVIVLPMIFISSAVLFTLIERPFMNPHWLTNFSRAWSKAAPITESHGEIAPSKEAESV